MKVLVTGGAGFIGSSLLRELSLNKNLQLFSLDNYFTGTKKNHVKGVTYITGSTCDIKKHIKFSPDIIYHFGEYSRVSTSFEDLNKVWEYNILGTKRVVEFCLENKSKLIYSASSTKFGDSGDNRNASPYAFYKYYNTEMIKRYHEWFELKYSTCYFYNVYGAGQISEGKYATVIGIFENQNKLGKPLTIVSPGTQHRDFTHISDIVDGLKILMNPKISGDGYCFGTGKSYSINEVASMFGGTVTYLPVRLGERKNTTIDLTKSKKIGWKSKIDLKEYIKGVKK